jgi:RHH-type proline utilization regulon transcriptional repressor/proline dehydrogenase/delta 1-pyrroline-5-carboxylate dehydrogenase
MEDLAAVERRTQSIGRTLLASRRTGGPSILSREYWDERLMSLAMRDEAVKTQLFRFVDVLPTLRTSSSLTRHLREYLGSVSHRLPWMARPFLRWARPGSIAGNMLAAITRFNARGMASKFIAGTSTPEVLRTVDRLRKERLAFTLDLLGEAIISEVEAEQYAAAYADLLRQLPPLVSGWPDDPTLDRDAAGPIPRVNVSIKLSALYSQFNPVDPYSTADAVKQRLRPLLRLARQQGAYVHVDMEHYAFKDLTLEIFKQVLLEPEFRDWPHVGIVIQTYLPDAERDLNDLLEWVRDRGTSVCIRLVKGAYWDFETVIAEARGWPIPVYQRKWQSDDNFERQAAFLMQNHQWLRPALASHNLRSLAHGLAWAEHLGVPRDAYELQVLYGMGMDHARLLVAQGYRVRVYTPFGELIPGMAYLVRRLLENTSNDSFLRASNTSQVSTEELLMRPSDHARALPPVEPKPKPPGFTTEPATDFGIPANRDSMQRAIEHVRGGFGREYPLVIGGQRITTADTIASYNPSMTSVVIGRSASATADDARRAVEAARKAFPAWSRVPAVERAAFLDRLADRMQERRFELSAWILSECGKPWVEADADVAEAIDFCRYYAEQMRRLDQPIRCDVPGEENEYVYRPRGVVAVIAPWNFPLAILTGMSVAAVVTGNTVVIKPAEQTPVIAARLMEMCESVGFPPGVFNYLPGVGEVIGPVLVEHSEVDMIAFTGSMTVGLSIYATAARTDPRQHNVKRVIAEMGGKNAIIVDDDANLDEAVAGVAASAFGYAGQKCSACSRVIVLKEAYDEFLKRLIAASDSLKIGPADEPGSFIGPVIDDESRQRIRKYIEIGKTEGRLVLGRSVGELESRGTFIGPHIFADVSPAARIAQEEIFGPVLAVIKAGDFDEALRIANGTRFALTGGVFSRSPVHLNRARVEFAVGNLYLNRGITGALVQRHPFGGYKMSGVGSKAGGPDYLQQFLVPVNISENTLRRGFTPPEEVARVI